MTEGKMPLGFLMEGLGIWAARKLLILEREMGFEPTTSSLGSWHSTTELLPLRVVFNSLHDTKDLIPQSRQSIQFD